MNRFFVEPDAISGTQVTIPDETAAQIRKVLRLKEGTRVQFLDNRGWVYDSEIHYLSEKQLSAEVLEKRPAENEPDVCISLYVGLTQREKFEWMLQKCTEAGVGRVIPMVTERSLIRSTADVAAKRERWEKILKEASEQCGRGRIPVLCPAVTFPEAVRQGSSADLKLFCWEEEKQRSLREQLQALPHRPKEIAVMVGPEGGFSGEEAQSARAAGWQPVTLGKRIYRMETAALAAVMLTLYELENE